jgi:hypothetical protein
MQWRREITPSFYEFPILSFSRPHLSAYPDPGHVAQARNFPRINVHAQKSLCRPVVDRAPAEVASPADINRLFYAARSLPRVTDGYSPAS